MSNRLIELSIVSLVLCLVLFITGLVVGYNRALEQSTTLNEVTETMAMPTHAHEPREVEAPYPTLVMEILPDAKMGWNIFLQTEKFIFAPEQVNTEYVSGQGHAHLYINGERQTRLYGPSYYLKELPKGEHVIMVTLSGNDHSELYANGEQIIATQTLVVK